MPNWVYNTLTIKGDSLTVANIKSQLSQPLPSYTDDEGKTHTPEPSPISFWNVVHPPLDRLDEYHGTHGWKDGQQVGNTDINWYVWNNRNWGTKWDACRPDMFTDTPEEIAFTFDTAWSPPTCFDKLSEQFPTAEITLRFQEEQGWGGEVEFLNGEETEVETWDIPETHEDSMKYLDDCRCSWDDDQDSWFSDCPRQVQTEDAVAEMEDISELIG